MKKFDCNLCQQEIKTNKPETKIYSCCGLICKECVKKQRHFK